MARNDDAHPFQPGQQWLNEEGIVMDIRAVDGDVVTMRITGPGLDGYRRFKKLGKELQAYAQQHDLQPQLSTIRIHEVTYDTIWQMTLHLPEKESSQLIIRARRAGRVDLEQLEELIYCRASMYGEDIFDALRLKHWTAPLQKKPFIEWVPLWLLRKLGYVVGRLLP